VVVIEDPEKFINEVAQCKLVDEDEPITAAQYDNGTR
jgi:hypothetical protein